MNKIIFRLGLMLLSLGVASVSLAQQNEYNQNPKDGFQMATELYQQAAYGAAGKLFQEVLKTLPPSQGLMAENATFYAAECAAKTHQKDGEFLLLGFVNHYPESSWIPLAHFSLGEIYFDKRYYSQALKLFNSTSPSHLNSLQRQTYFYKKGYCLMKRNQNKEASKLFQEVMNTNSPYAKPASYFYAHIQYQKGNLDEAAKGFLAVKNDRRYRKFVPTYLIQIYYQQQQYQKLINLGITSLETSGRKQAVELNRMIANAYYQLGDFQKALPYFQTYENLSYTNITAEEAYRIGFTYMKNMKFNEAASEFQQATAGDDSLAQNAWYQLAYCYTKTQQARFAQNAFIKAYELGQSRQLTQDALLAYARLTIRQKGDPARNALELVQNFVTNERFDQHARRKASSLLVQLYLNSHNNQAAIATLEKADFRSKAMQSIYQELTYSQAVSFYQQNNFRQALSFFTKALQNTPDRSLKLKSLYWKADSYYRLLQFKNASHAYRMFLTSPGASSSGLYARANYDLAYCYFNQKDYYQAVLFFKRYLGQNPNSRLLKADANLRIADSYVAQSDFSAAQLWYDRVLKAGGGDAAYALYQKAYAYGSQGNFQKKVQKLLQLINSYPHSSYYSPALYDLASTFNSALNEPRKAIVYFARLVKEHPNSDFARKAQVKMGLLYYKNNQDEKAKVVLKKVIANYPASQDATVALSTLESIYKDQGRLDEYFAYAKTLNFVQVSVSQEDSLTFSVGEDAYLAGNCPKVIRALTNYVTKFPKGGFVLKADYYLSNCFARQNDTLQALVYYHKIITYPPNEYSRTALLNASRMEFGSHLYELSAKHYKKLESLSEDPTLKLESVEGAMRSYFLLGQLAEAQTAAHALLKTPGVNDNQIVYAHYVLAESALRMNNYSEAAREFNIVSKLDNGALGAESSFEGANLSFRDKKYGVTEKQVFALSDHFPDQIYWVAKGFILLSNVYVEKGNLFQARETLKSVVKNYPGEDLRRIAREKLQKLPAESTTKTNKPSAVSN